MKTNKNMVRHLRISSVIGSVLFPVMLIAQSQVNVPYHMSFETSEVAELVNWHMNMGVNAASCPDQWMVGADQYYDGSQSLYISNNGSTAQFGVAQNIQFAYRDFVLPQGRYIIAFDWKCMGSDNAYFYAGCGDVSMVGNCEATIDGQPLATIYTRWCQPATSHLNGERYWQNARITGVNSDGTNPVRLFFAWCSTNNDANLFNPLSACIDNILITKASVNPPANVTLDMDCDSTIVHWTGAGDSFELEYRRMGDANWHKRSGLHAPGGLGEVVIENLEEGMYDFRIRSIIANDTSVYTYLNSQTLFCPAAHCINYVDLHDNTGVITCRYGKWDVQWGSSTPVITENHLGVLDYGPDNMASRHTVNWDIDAYDARTRNRLPLIPDGELATVRLGNWDVYAEWESITYDYYVDSVYSILLLKYAVVLEDPGHSKVEQPRFTLSVKDQFGNEVDASCGSADFSAGRTSGNKGEGWHYESDLSWKEWTTYGINLTQFVGQHLQITVTTYDCSQSGHYGYAYFCLGCSEARIKGISCGDDSKMVANAPDGFAYAWTSIYDSLTVVSTEQTLEVDASDTTTYRCRLTYLDQPDCHFDVYSALYPRFPVAYCDYTYAPSNCQNRVEFNNLSHIMVKYEGDTTGTHHWDEPCEDYEWVINNEKISDKNPIYFFPEEGGQFPVTLFASIADGTCTNDTTFIVDIPAIGDVHIDMVDSICYGEQFVFGKNKTILHESGFYTDIQPSKAGCDSITTLDLTVLPEVPTTFGDTIMCEDVPMVIGGDVYPDSKPNPWIRRKKNIYGCDSTIVYNVDVRPMLKPTIANVMPYVCVPDSGEQVTLTLPYSIVTDTALVAIEIYTSDEAQAAGFEDKYVYDVTGKDSAILRTRQILIPIEWSSSKKWVPGSYQFDIRFRANSGCDAERSTLVEMRHSLSAVSQIYGYMFVQNASLNGGYNFTSFQWYKNGVKIPGATTYYIELDDDNKDAVFYCMVSYSEGDTVSTCPIRYDWTTSDPHAWEGGFDKNKNTDLNNVNAKLMCVPTSAPAGAEILVTTNEALQIFDMLGRRVDSYVEQTESYQIITAPYTPGIYIVKSKTGATARIFVE